MTATRTEARDDIMELVNDAWTPTTWQIQWPDKPADVPTTPDPWARAVMKHASGTQASLAGDTGQRRWTRTGVLTIQVFTPAGEGLSRSDVLSTILVDALEGASTPHGVWFREVRAQEIGPDGDWYQVNVMAVFEYDEVK